jgi:hypothetical protein
MKARDAVIFWTPASMEHEKTAGKMLVLARKDKLRGYSEYVYSDLGDWNASITASDAKIAHWVLGIAFKAMLRDGLSPDSVARALWKIEELRDHLMDRPADVVALKKA